MKKFISLLLVIVISFTIVGCSAQNNENNTENGSVSPESYTEGGHNDIIDEEETEPATPVSQWGFNNIYDFTDDLGRTSLVGTTGYNLTDGYVKLDTFHGVTAFAFENGFVSKCSLTENGDIRQVFDTMKYDVVNNDTLHCYEGYDDINIKNRIGTDVSDDFVAFEIRWNNYTSLWFVPSALIDWSKGKGEIEENGETVKILYLK